jgi:glycosyltransferase involved in cell wall biosynthesis
LERRCFPPLLAAPRIEGRWGEWARLARRAIFGQLISAESLAYEANDWLMRVMERECSRESVTAVHSYEDCSLLQFVKAKRLGKSCIYDLPIGYYPAWEETQTQLMQRYSDVLPASGLSSRRYVRPEQKRREMELADVVLVPSSFVKGTIQRFIQKRIAIAPYGVDSEFWSGTADTESDSKSIRFIYAGQCSIRKGTPLLIDAWKAADLRNAELRLVGSWQLSERVKRELPKNVYYFEPVDPTRLRHHYQQSDIFVFPSFFEGFGLVILEAMACALPVIASDATAAPDILDEGCGKIVPAGDVDRLVEALRFCSTNRDRLESMGRAARVKAQECSWENYRRSVSAAVGDTK